MVAADHGGEKLRRHDLEDVLGLDALRPLHDLVAEIELDLFDIAEAEAGGLQRGLVGLQVLRANEVERRRAVDMRDRDALALEIGRARYSGLRQRHDRIGAVDPRERNHAGVGALGARPQRLRMAGVAQPISLVVRGLKLGLERDDLHVELETGLIAEFVL